MQQYKIILTLVLGVVTILTTIGNILILYLFRRSKKALRSPCHWLIANLAVSDLLVGTVVMPGLLLLTVNDLKWTLGDLACWSSEPVHFALCAASMFSMIFIAGDRYVGVTFPLRHHRILCRRRILIILSIVWVLSITLTSGPLMVWPVEGNENSMKPDFCEPNLRPDFIFFVSITLYFLPLLVTGILYYKTYKNAVKSYDPKDPGLMSTVSNVTTARKMGDTKLTLQEKWESRRKKQNYLAKRLAIVVLMMLLCFAPLFIVFFLIGIQVINEPSLTMLLVLGWIRYLCSGINPYLYLLVVPGYKQAFKKYVLKQGNTFTTEGESSETNNRNTKSEESWESVRRKSRRPPTRQERTLSTRSNLKVPVICHSPAVTRSNDSGYHEVVNKTIFSSTLPDVEVVIRSDTEIDGTEGIKSGVDVPGKNVIEQAVVQEQPDQRRSVVLDTVELNIDSEVMKEFEGALATLKNLD